MDNREITIESKITIVNEFRQHLYRSLDNKSLVSKDRIESSHLLLKNFNDSNGLRLFMRAQKNEEPFLELVRKGLIKSRIYLTEAANWIKIRSTNQSLLLKINRLFELMDSFESAFEITNIRSRKESLFLIKRDDDSFYDFMTAWANEVESDRKLMNNVKDVAELDAYFKEVGAEVRYGLRAGFNTPKFNSIITSWNISFRNPAEFMSYFSYCSLLNSLSLMFLTFYELEVQLDEVNVKTLNSLNIN